jgi:recombination protein RecT
MDNQIEKKQEAPIVVFQNQLGKYEQTVADLLGTKYGISPQEFMVKVLNAVKKTPALLTCTPQSLFGSILYFAEIGLPFNTPEGFGYILPYKNKGQVEATPIIGYKGLVEMAYRNPKVKSIRIQSVYEKDSFDYEYGTNEYIRHKPCQEGDRGKLKAVYAIAQVEGINPLFVVVHKPELDKIQKLSKSGGSEYSPYNNGTDVFNIMQSKVAIKLLFKTLPKTDNDALIKVLEMDNKFDYEKNVKIAATEKGYEVIEIERKMTALEEVNIEEIDIKVTEDFKQKKEKPATATNGELDL